MLCFLTDLTTITLKATNLISLFNETYFGSDSWTFIKITEACIESKIIAIILRGLFKALSKEKIED